MRLLKIQLFAVCTAVLACVSPAVSQAAIDGITGPTFNLGAKVDFIQTPDGGAPIIWGYSNGSARGQYPGPTLIVNEGDTVTVNLTNSLPDQATSIIFPGQTGVVATGGATGLITQEAAAGGGTVSYSFVADKPGTFLYQSGTRPDLQVEMGLFGALIVRPAMGANFAYNDSATEFDREYLFLQSEMDPRIHFMVETPSQGVAALDSTDYLQKYVANWWFFNGRNGPDTLFPPNLAWLPTQPYNCLPRMHPGERTLMRLVGGGRNAHPFHPHGNHTEIVARNGRLLQSAPGAGVDLSVGQYTVQTLPGETVDAIWHWTGEKIGWDVYGNPSAGPQYIHTCNDGPDADLLDDVTSEYCPDHYKPIPVDLPESLDLGFGGLWGGSPYLGQLGSLPPGEGGLNPYGAFTFIWHSHAEKELVNYDIFPGGMLTFMFVESRGVCIDDDGDGFDDVTACACADDGTCIP